MERIPNAVYTKEFREEAVMTVTEGGLTVPEVARRLSIPKSTISYWVRAKRRGTLSSVGGQARPLSDEEREIAHLRRCQRRWYKYPEWRNKMSSIFVINLVYPRDVNPGGVADAQKGGLDGYQGAD